MTKSSKRPANRPASEGQGAETGKEFNPLDSPEDHGPEDPSIRKPAPFGLPVPATRYERLKKRAEDEKLKPNKDDVQEDPSARERDE